MEHPYLELARKLKQMKPNGSRRMLIILAKNYNRKRKKPTAMGL